MALGSRLVLKLLLARFLAGSLLVARPCLPCDLLQRVEAVVRIHVHHLVEKKKGRILSFVIWACAARSKAFVTLDGSMLAV
jgi:hypothetical protein